MKYKKKENSELDLEFAGSSARGMNIRLSDNVLFYRKMLHWEYIKKDEVERVHRKIEEVITHTSCCAENMDIQWLIITNKNGEEIKVHVCDGEPRLAEKLYDDMKNSWTGVEFGTKEIKK